MWHLVFICNVVYTSSNLFIQLFDELDIVHSLFVSSQLLRQTKLKIKHFKIILIATIKRLKEEEKTVARIICQSFKSL